jgi:hypothetical protein
MPTRHLIAISAAAAVISIVAPDARADVNLTGFLGASTTPSTRSARGLAAGAGILVVAFEFEYSNMSQEQASGTPALDTAMFNGMIQTPFVVKRLQFYGTIGGGIYRETLGDYDRVSSGIDYGGGVKISIAGSLKARMDYRLFDLHGSARVPKPQRVYGALMLSF